MPCLARYASGGQESEPCEGAQAPASASLLLLLDALDALESCNALDASVIFCVFMILSYSYQWLSPNQPRPNRVQEVRRLLLDYIHMQTCNGHGMRKPHAWLDVFSNLQFQDGCKLIAVNSFYVYAAAADAVIIPQKHN